MSSNPRFVIAVRHGDDEAGGLSREGKAQVESLVKKLAELIPPNSSVAVFNSTYGRARATAAIIGAAFKVGPQELKALGNDQYEDGPAMARLLCQEANGADVVIGVTHFEAPPGIADALSQELGLKKVHCFEPDYANGILVDRASKKVLLDLFQP